MGRRRRRSVYIFQHHLVMMDEEVNAITSLPLSVPVLSAEVGEAANATLAATQGQPSIHFLRAALMEQRAASSADACSALIDMHVHPEATLLPANLIFLTDMPPCPELVKTALWRSGHGKQNAPSVQVGRTQFASRSGTHRFHDGSMYPRTNVPREQYGLTLTNDVSKDRCSQASPTEQYGLNLT